MLRVPNKAHCAECLYAECRGALFQPGRISFPVACLKGVGGQEVNCTVYFPLYSLNTKGGSITVPLISCLTGLESAVWQLTIFVLFIGSDISIKSLKRKN